MKGPAGPSWPFPERTKRSMAALDDAQRIAFGPVAFHCARLLRDRGVLAALGRARAGGLDAPALAAETGLSPYAVTVLAEAGVAMGALSLADGRFRLTKVGWFLEHDPMTRANLDFVADVCAAPLAHLGDALDRGAPAGLPALGVEADTVYEGLGRLSPQALRSWLAFDHFYSDEAAAPAVEAVLRPRPAHVVDVGGNTGRFAERFLRASPDVRVTLVDLPAQLGWARRALDDAGLGARLAVHAADVRAPDVALPPADAVWMSQFLVCFPPAEAVHILRAAARATAPDGRVWVMDACWDRAPNPTAAYVDAMTSPYFAAVANGTSRMYRYDELVGLAAEAGLEPREVHHGLGIGHTLLGLGARRG